MNAKGSKNSKVGRWAQSFLRWGVWVCTGFLLVAVVASFWINIGGMLRYPASPKASREPIAAISIVYSKMSLMYTLEPQEDLFEWFWSGKIITRWYADHDNARKYWGARDPWQPLPRVRSAKIGGMSYRYVSISLAYPAALMFGWSLWLVRGQRKLRRRVGCCSECGYSLDGLSRGVCPECGEQYAQSGV